MTISETIYSIHPWKTDRQTREAIDQESSLMLIYNLRQHDYSNGSFKPSDSSGLDPPITLLGIMLAHRIVFQVPHHYRAIHPQKALLHLLFLLRQRTRRVSQLMLPLKKVSRYRGYRRYSHTNRGLTRHSAFKD